MKIQNYLGFPLTNLAAKTNKMCEAIAKQILF